MREADRRFASADFSPGKAMTAERGLHATAMELLRYLAVSLAALAVDTAGLLLAANFVHYLWAATFGFVLGATTSYLLSVRWVFRHRRMAAYPRTEFLAYSLVGILSLGINNLVIFVAVEYFALALLASKAVAAGATFTFNYGVRKFVLFRK